MNDARATVVLFLLAALPIGCGDSGAAAPPTVADQQKVQEISKNLTSQIGFPTAKGMSKTAPKARH